MDFAKEYRKGERKKRGWAFEVLLAGLVSLLFFLIFGISIYGFALARFGVEVAK